MTKCHEIICFVNKTQDLNFALFFFQSLKFAIFDWSKPSQDHQDQDSMGTMECTLAEAIAASSKGKFERGLSPFRQHLGDSGVGKLTVHYAPEIFKM